MDKFDIYSDIATRCGGDIYIGVVGPVRTGKSTFISRFIENVVIPNVSNKHKRDRLKDELPQQGAGKTIMTTEPKFIPGEAVKLSLGKKLDANVRLIDCVGYLVEGALGTGEDGVPRMVNTPWSENPMSFEQAAEMGTEKVINDHSTIGVLVTTDGSITDIDRESYVSAEERVVEELKAINKPFVTVLNSKNPDGEACQSLKAALEKKYNVPILALNVAKMSEGNIAEIMEQALYEFAFKRAEIKLPSWIGALDVNDEMIHSLVQTVKASAKNLTKMSDYKSIENIFDGSEYLCSPVTNVELATGTVTCSFSAVDGLFYKVLSKECGVSIANDFELVSSLKSLLTAKTEYDKIALALADVKANGYGVVVPSIEEMSLEVPELSRQGAQCGVKLKASAPSLHIMRVDVDTEINPIVGTEQQSEELVKYLLKEFESDPKGIWQTNMFGKSLNSLVNEGLNNKLVSMPTEVKDKMRRTVSRIVNEGKGGVICILL